MCLGFALPDNFRFPYAAIGFSDFWRRWHISLSSWLRDYLYIPLGGNRISPTRTHVNLMLTMLIGGLWHGAAWTFIAWGGLHGLFLILEHQVRMLPLAKWTLWKNIFGRTFLVVGTFLLVCLTWTFFRADSIMQAVEMCWHMLLLNRLNSPSEQIVIENTVEFRHILATFATVAGLLLIQGALRNTTLEEAVGRLPSFAWSGINAFMLTAIILMPGEDNAFIYFQF